MSEEYRLPSIGETMHQMLRTLRDYYDCERAYYIELDDDDIDVIYEWTQEGESGQRDKLKLADNSARPKWLCEEQTDTTADSYSVFCAIHENRRAVLAAVGVHRGGCEMYFLQSLLPYAVQAVRLYKTQKQQEYLSYHDDLTGVLNRNSFVRYMAKEKGYLKSLGALSIDINGLKNFNKEFGREYGDELVIRVSEILEETCRGAMVYRLTGDEFLVLCEQISFDDFMKRQQEVSERLNMVSLGLASVGHAWEKSEISVDSVVFRAEAMMREEKQRYYKNRRKGHHEPVIKKDLLQDLEEGNFIICLIPKMDVSSLKVIGAEAVVRYQHRDLGVLNPAKYLSLLEQTRLSHHLDMYVFEQVCLIINRWTQKGYPLIPISVNFAPSTLCQADLEEQLETLTKKHQVPCEYLEIEVSESYEVMNQDMFMEMAGKIRRANIRVTLDHFGSRDSGIAVLGNMEFDALKLDESITERIVSSSRVRTMAEAIIRVGHQLGGTVMAAGVETQDQLNVLSELGCDCAQGSLFNKAITEDSFVARYMNDL